MNLALETQIIRLINAAKINNQVSLRLNNLNLTVNDLEEIVVMIEKELPNLETLHLTQNNLDSLPNNFKKLCALKTLYLSIK